MPPKRKSREFNITTQAKRQRTELCSLCYQRQQCVATTFPIRLYFLLALIPSLTDIESLFEKEADDVQYLASCIRLLVDQPDLCKSVMTRLQELLQTKKIEEYKSLLSKDCQIDAKKEYAFLVHLVDQLEARHSLLLGLFSDPMISLDTLFLIEVTLTRALAVLTVAHRIKLKEIEEAVVLSDHSDSELIDISNCQVSEPIETIAAQVTIETSVSMPDYEALSTPELRAKLKSYGYKSGGRRTQMIEDLQKIFNTIHCMKSTAPVKSKLIQPDELEEETMTAKEQLSPETRNKIVKHLKENKLLWDQILRYEVYVTFLGIMMKVLIDS
ncbi:hypothetical protein BD560DRAFT_421165 [Blakeslea trispora]|nr:hypothetical protein BD560DRAFT_421165 [Blakeslea trispora]